LLARLIFDGFGCGARARITLAAFDLRHVVQKPIQNLRLAVHLLTRASDPPPHVCHLVIVVLQRANVMQKRSLCYGLFLILKLEQQSTI
jgi:hypothetical protein